MRPSPRRPLLLIPGLVIVFSLAGCDGCDGGRPPTADAGGTPVAPGNSAVAADPGKPASADQLAGAWFRIDDPASETRYGAVDTIGVEFAPDGRLALIGRPMGREAPVEVTVKYTKLEDGRIRLTTDASALISSVMQCNLNGDTLTITPETSSQALGFDGGQFQRLPKGKTIVARYRERVQEQQAEAAALGQKLDAFLKQPNLAIVPAEGGGVGSTRIALNLKPNGGSYAGTAYLTVADTTFERQAQLYAQPQNQPPTVTVNLGPVTGPPGAKPMQQETLTFAASAGKDGAIALRDDRAQALRVDADATKQLTDAYAAGIKKQRDVLDAFHAKLGMLVLAEGEARPNQPPQRVALLRVPDKDQYVLAAYQGSEATLMPAHFTQPYVVMLHQGEALLVSPQTNQILSILGEGTDRRFEGMVNGTPTRAKITQTMTLDDLKARQAAIKTFLDGMKATPVALVGQYYESYTYDQGKVTPSRLELSSPDGKTLAGTYQGECYGAEFPVSGEATPTLLGLAVKYVAPANYKRPDARFVESFPCTAIVDLADGKPTLTGRFQNGDGAGRLELRPADDGTRAAALRKQFDAALASGGAFKWARTGSTGASSEMLTITLKPGDSAGTLTGTGGFRRATSPITGTIAEDKGQLVIDLTVPETTPPKTPGSGKVRLWVLPYGDQIYLSGYREWKGDQGKTFVCFGTAQ